MAGTRKPETVSLRLQRIAEQARRDPDRSFISLNHHLDLDLLREAYRLTRKDGATGVDGVTAVEYAKKLEGNLQTLLDRAKSGTYRAPPVRRVYIPKDKPGETRPLGIPTFEDKVLQRAVAMILGAIYEEDFCDCSYGFRPGRSQHMALDALWGRLRRRGGWVLEVDLRRFFDSVDHGHIRDVLSLRVRDGVIRRLVGKWLKAGVMEAGQVTYPDEGTPQGGVISPLLSNIFLHHVLDRWWHEDVMARLGAEAHLIRFADDFVLVFQSEADARRVMEVLPKRFGRFGLKVHPKKTRLVRFERPPDGGDRPTGTGTFDLLGFTHYWGKSRQGNWVVCRKTRRSRLTRALTRIWEHCRRTRHDHVAAQRRSLAKKLNGHYAYYGITGNYRALQQCFVATCVAWKHWLNRRSNSRWLSWTEFRGILRRHPLPRPRVVHSVYARP